MADLTLTPANILRPDSNSTIIAGFNAGVVILAGDWLYLDVNSVWRLADSTTLAKSKVVGMALNSAGIGQPAIVISFGNVTASGLTKGTAYFLSPTADSGKMVPAADALLTTNKYIIPLGVASSTTNFYVNPSVTTGQY